MSGTFHRRFVLGAILAGVTYPSQSLAGSVTETVVLRLDARNDVKAAIREYHETIEEHEKNEDLRSLTVFAKILIDGSKGFDCAALRLPRNLRRVRLYIRLIITRGSIRRDIEVNEIDLRYSPRLYLINQQTIIY